MPDISTLPSVGDGYRKAKAHARARRAVMEMIERWEREDVARAGSRCGMLHYDPPLWAIFTGMAVFLVLGMAPFVWLFFALS